MNALHNFIMNNCIMRKIYVQKSSAKTSFPLEKKINFLFVKVGSYFVFPMRLFVFVCVCACLCVCMYVFMYVCMYDVCMCVCVCAKFFNSSF